MLSLKSSEDCEKEEPGMCLVWLKHSKEASVPGVGEVKGRAGGGEARRLEGLME